MKKYVITLLLFATSYGLRAQKLDSLFFNLYTDSLKKGTYNYINVDGRYSNGSYLPLTANELIFSANHGEFDGNSLFLDSSIKADKITVKVVLKSNPAVFREKTIYIKTLPESEKLKTVDEILNSPGKKRKDRRSAVRRQ